MFSVGRLRLAIGLVPAATSSAQDKKKVADGAAVARSVPEPPRSSAQSGAVTADWPCWLGPNHDSKSLDKGLLKEWPEGGPKQLWKVSGIGNGFSSVAVAGGKIYVTGTEKGKGTLSALDGDGKVLWTTDCGRQRGQAYPNSPAVDGGNVYTLDANGLLICHDAETGKKKWSREMREFGGGSHEHGYTESPLVVGDKVIFSPGGKNCIVAFDKTTGKDVWKSTGFADGVMYSSCISFVFDGMPMIVNGTGGGLRCVNAKTGELLWKDGSCVAPWSVPTPCFGEGYVIWANGYGKGGVCMKLNPDGTAKQAWTSRDMDCLTGNYVIDNGYIYASHGDGLHLPGSENRQEEVDRARRRRRLPLLGRRHALHFQQGRRGGPVHVLPGRLEGHWENARLPATAPARACPSSPAAGCTCGTGATCTAST